MLGVISELVGSLEHLCSVGGIL